MDVLGFRNLLKEINNLIKTLNIEQTQPTIQFCDNMPAIRIAYMKGSLSEKSKALDIRVFKIQELLANKQIVLNHISTLRNISDIFTKSLAAAVFIPLRNQLKGYATFSPNA